MKSFGVKYLEEVRGNEEKKKHKLKQRLKNETQKKIT